MALEVSAKPLVLRSPLTRYCAALLREPRALQQKALAALRPIVEASLRRRALPPGQEPPPPSPRRSRPLISGAACAPALRGCGAPQGSADALDADDDDDAAACVNLAACEITSLGSGAVQYVTSVLWSAEAADGAGDAAVGSSPRVFSSQAAAAHIGGIDWADAPERVAFALASAAPSLFDDVSGLAVSSTSCVLNHSCVPNVRLETTPSGWLAARALRHIAPGEELTIAYVRCDAPLAERRAALAESLHGFVCTCCRCAMDADARRVADMPAADVHALAASAQLEGRFADAAALLRALLARPLPPRAPPDAEAIARLGLCLRALGRWTEAAALWADATRRRVPVTAARAAAAAQDGSYWPAEAAPMQLSMDDYAVVPSDDDFTLLPLGGAADDVAVLSAAPLLSPDGCARAVAAAEATAAARPGGADWASGRDFGGVPCAAMPLHEVPSLLAWFNDALRTSVAPLLIAAFPYDIRLPAQLRVLDAFVVRYDAATPERHLPPHAHADAAFSLSIALNPEAEYVGGGTFFEASRAVVRPDVGHVLAFRGGVRHGGEPLTAGVRHGGEPLTAGVRYMIACNLLVVPEAEAARATGVAL
jgi:hypothetical protein